MFNVFIWIIIYFWSISCLFSVVAFMCILMDIIFSTTVSIVHFLFILFLFVPLHLAHSLQETVSSCLLPPTSAYTSSVFAHDLKLSCQISKSNLTVTHGVQPFYGHRPEKRQRGLQCSFCFLVFVWQMLQGINIYLSQCWECCYAMFLLTLFIYSCIVLICKIYLSDTANVL